ncbi:MAG: hypothetical protein JWQ09_3040 [Segetibacter sp.]|nr:hypothetical protein [Segetibacter sp.]
MKALLKLTSVIEEASEGGYISYFEEIPGVNTQGETFEEAKANLTEALELILETLERGNFSSEEVENYLLMEIMRLRRDDEEISYEEYKKEVDKKLH